MISKPAGLPDDVWESIMHPSPAHCCYECRFCMPVPDELRAKGRAHSYCCADLPVYRTGGIKIEGRWYSLISSKQVISCKHFEPVKGASR